jgi:ATP-binding cassette subfamily B protein
VIIFDLLRKNMSVELLLQPNTHRARPRLYRDLLGRYLLPLWPRVLWMSFFLLAGIAFQLASPQVIRYFLDTAQSGVPAGEGQPGLWAAAAIYILFALGQQGMVLAAAYASQVVSWSATNRLRVDLARHCLRLDMTFHKRHTPGEMIERIEGDVWLLANFFSSFIVQVVGNFLLVAGILALLFREDGRIGIAMTFYTLVVFFALNRIQRLAVPRWAASRQAAGDLSGYLEERIAGTEDLRAVGAEEYALHRLLGLMRAYLEKSRSAWVIGSMAYNLTNLLYVIGYAAGLALGAFLYTRGESTLGAAYLVVHYVGMLSGPLQKIREQADDYQQAAAGLGRIQSLLDLRPNVAVAPPADFANGESERNGGQRSTANASGTHSLTGPLSVAFEEVSFHYEEDENVLEDVTFHIQPGQTLGILGRTGSGKSTLTRLLFHLYDPTRGRILLGSQDTGTQVDLRDLSLEDLRQRVGLVTQDVQLFQATVRDNLTFFDPSIPDERLESILRELSLWKWVSTLPDGLQTQLGAGGQGLSAGEAQLLAFARVFLKDPGLVVLDEASSRLDPATEMRMERAIDRLFTRRTGIIIAHRLRTVQRADLILILEGGRVIESGARLTLAADPGSHFAGLLRTGLEEVLA